jgi:NAD(P)-dependent dehydrogenase (short-subunit alcohol dehydrogenase family)
MQVAGAVALVRGANRGLGLALVHALLEAGASRVYAAARNPDAVKVPGVVPLKLDVTHDKEVVAAARAAGDVTLLVNNAGIARPGGFLAEGAVDWAREQFEVNFLGPLRMARAFAPVLADEISRKVHRGLSADPPVYFASTSALTPNAALSAG